MAASPCYHQRLHCFSSCLPELQGVACDHADRGLHRIARASRPESSDILVTNSRLFESGTHCSASGRNLAMFCHHMPLLRCCFYCLVLIGLPFPDAWAADPFPGTKPLEWKGDLASRMIDQLDAFLRRKTARVAQQRRRPAHAAADGIHGDGRPLGTGGHRGRLLGLLRPVADGARRLCARPVTRTVTSRHCQHCGTSGRYANSKLATAEPR